MQMHEKIKPSFVSAPESNPLQSEYTDTKVE